MGQDVAIEFRNVSKRYRIGAGQGSLRSALSDLFSRNAGKRQENANTLWALRDVSFELKRGETLGIIGHNGAGKTTILKLLSRITRPTEGEIVLHGRVSSLIELGAGFHPELTGRENVFLNGQILGMSRREIARRYDEIVAFSELDGFMDTPVKRYSSGMYARLGFSVAAHLDPDILLVDEVLAVGDVGFQQKCLKHMTLLTRRGTSVIFVSHNMEAVRTLCNRCIWLDRGIMKTIDATNKVIEAFLSDMELRQLAHAAQQAIAIETDTGLTIRKAIFRSAIGQESNDFSSGDDIIIDLHLYATQSVDHPHVSIGIGRVQRDIAILASTLVDGNAPTLVKGDNIVRCHLKSVPLMPGNYEVKASVREAQGYVDIVKWGHVGTFHVRIDPSSSIQIAPKPSITHLNFDAPIYVAHEWVVISTPQ